MEKIQKLVINHKNGTSAFVIKDGNAPAFNEAQDKTDKEKAQARENTGAAAAFEPTEYSIPIVYLEGDTTGISKDEKVTLIYRYGERSGTCTLKWQGSSSINYPKKNFTIEFDNTFEAADGWGEQKKYVLKADWIDFSHCRNVVSAKLWGEIVKSRATSDLAYRLSALVNGGAIDGFPCFVVINGKWQGVYNFNIPKDGVMFDMGDGTNEAILCGANQSPGNLFHGEAVLDTLAGTGETVAYDLEYASDTFADEDIQASLNTLITACINSDGTDIDTAIAQRIDIDSAIDYYIFTILLKGIDITSKNMILATYDGVKWFCSAYDLDSTWGLYMDGKRFIGTVDDAAENNLSFFVFSQLHRLMQLLYRYKKEEIIARYKELRNGILSVSNVAEKFYNYARIIPLNAYVEDANLWKVIPSASVSNVDQIVTWYQSRADIVDAEIAQMELSLGTKGLTYEYTNSYGTMLGTCTGIGDCMESDIVIRGDTGGSYTQKIGRDAFNGNTFVETCILPDKLAQIDTNAFMNCKQLKRISIPDTVWGVGYYAFSGCVNLALAKLSASQKELAAFCFQGCTNLSTVYIPKGLTQIQKSAFSGCSALKHIHYEGTMEEWTSISKVTDPAWDANTGLYTVHCSDGDVTKS